MLREVVSRTSGERLAVELEIGPLLWLRNERGEVERASREHLPADRWEFLNTEVSNVDLFESR